MSISDTKFIDDIAGRVATLRDLAGSIAHIAGDYSEEHSAEDRCESAKVIGRVVQQEAATLCLELERVVLDKLAKGMGHV